MSRVVILCAHPDDEVIGASRWLGRGVSLVYPSEVEEFRRTEVVRFAERWGMRCAFLEDWRLGVEWESCAKLLAPDFYFETHPAHRQLGMEAWATCRTRGRPLVVYSTNMLAPYIVELSLWEQVAKRAMLEAYFPSQADLWKYDHRYWRFEGCAEWNCVG